MIRATFHIPNDALGEIVAFANAAGATVIMIPIPEGAPDDIPPTDEPTAARTKRNHHASKKGKTRKAKGNRRKRTKAERQAISERMIAMHAKRRRALRKAERAAANE